MTTIDRRIEAARDTLHNLRGERPLLRDELNAIDKLLDHFEAAQQLAEGLVADVEADDRFKAKAAAVQINAPLALVQVALKQQRYTAKQVLATMGG